MRYVFTRLEFRDVLKLAAGLTIVDEFGEFNLPEIIYRDGPRWDTPDQRKGIEGLKMSDGSFLLVKSEFEYDLSDTTPGEGRRVPSFWVARCSIHGRTR